MIRVFVSGMLAGMGLYSEIQKMRLEAKLKAAQTENKLLRIKCNGEAAPSESRRGYARD